MPSKNKPLTSKDIKAFAKTLNTKKKRANFLVKTGIYTKKGNLRKPYKFSKRLVLRTANENVYAWINQEKTIITNEDTDNSTALSKQEAIDIAKQILEYYQS